MPQSWQKKNYKMNFTILSIRGYNHECKFFRPKRAFHKIWNNSRLLSNNYCTPSNFWKKIPNCPEAGKKLKNKFHISARDYERTNVNFSKPNELSIKSEIIRDSSPIVTVHPVIFPNFSYCPEAGKKNNCKIIFTILSIRDYNRLRLHYIKPIHIR